MSLLPETGDFGNHRHRLLVSVDFGTTYTGVAYCLSSATSLDQIETITTWPGSSGSVEKIPTEICYVRPGSAPLWGADANGTMYSRQANGNPNVYGRFKLLLDPTIGRDVYGELTTKPNFDVGDSSSKISLPTGKTAVDVSSDYLKQLYSHIMGTILSKRLPGVLDQTPIQFIFTVPAIWSHQAQAATQLAAERAGFGPTGRPDDTISMISEPEAAAVYAITSLHEEKAKREQSGLIAREMAVGEHFIVCDAGGGTVDLITYQIQEQFPDLKLRESVVGGGGKCGSTYIDEGFHRLLRSRIGPSFDDENIWTPKKKGRGSHLMQRFEVCKRTFGQVGHDMWFLELPVDVPDDEQNFIIDNEMELKDTDMKSLFDPVVDDIIALVEAQADKLKQENSVGGTQGKLTTVVLVGGFGESQYLFSRLWTWGQQQYPCLTIVNPTKSWSAIMRGAVAQALRPAVRSRKLRCHYGFVCSAAYNERFHDISKARLCVWGGDWRIDDNVEWAGTMGQDCSSEKLVQFPIFYDLTKTEITNGGCELLLRGCRYKERPREESSHKVLNMGKIVFDFSDIDVSCLPQKVVSGVTHYKLNGKAKMHIGSADVTFSFWIGNKCYGKAHIAYDD